MSFKTVTVALALLATSGLPVQASAEPTRSSSVRIQGYVPVMCRVQLASSIGILGEDGMIDLGVAREFCNAPRGYRVILQHAPDLDGAAIVRDGQRIPLSRSGETVLTDSSHANVQNVALAVDPGSAPAAFKSIAIRIEARA